MAAAAAGGNTVRRCVADRVTQRHLKGHSAANCPITAADFPFSGFPTPNSAGGGDREREKRKANPRVTETTVFPSSQAVSFKGVSVLTTKIARNRYEKR